MSSGMSSGMSTGTIRQLESELIADFENAPAGLAGGTRLVLGKKPPAFNAMKHGLSGHNLMLNSDEVPHYATMGLEFMREMRPVGVREISTAQLIFEIRWRLHRILSVENDLFYTLPAERATKELAEVDLSAEGPGTTPPGKPIVRRPGWNQQSDAFRDEARNIEIVSRYETRLIRNSTRLAEELEAVQKRRGKSLSFDDASSPATAWYRRLVDRANALAQTRQDYKDQSEANANPPQTPIKNDATKKDPAAPAPEPVTRSAAATSSPDPFCKIPRAEAATKPQHTPHTAAKSRRKAA